MVVVQQEKKQSDWLTGAFHDAPLGMALVAADGRWLEVNGALCRLLGYDSLDLRTRTLADVVVPGDRITLGAWMTCCLEGREPVNDAHVRFEKKDGQSIHVLLRASVARDSTGVPTHLIVHLQDDTEQLRHNRKLEESEALYRTLADSFPGGSVLLFDRDLRYRIAGGEALEAVGLRREELEGKTVWEALPPAVAEVVADQYRTALAGEDIKAEAPFRDRVLYTQNVPVRDDRGEIIAGMVIALDITERKRTEEELARSNRDLEQFAYVASHDLREPLRMVTSYCQLLQRRYEGRIDEDADEFIHYAVDGAQRMQVLIDDLLAFSRAGRAASAFHLVSCGQVMEQVLFDLQVCIEEAEAEVNVSALPVVHGDPVQLAQVFRNLVSNAVKFRGDRPPTLSVCAHRDGDLWVFSVSDNGIGIEEQHRVRIFEVFQRLHGRAEYAGTGIGLAIAKRVVEGHGGTIWVDSIPGEGSTFSFVLPVLEE